MSIGRRIIRIASVVVLGIAATGCIVLPYGARHERHERGDRDYARPAPRLSDTPPPQWDRPEPGRR